MKMAISATGTNLDTQVAPRFGRCRYFVIVDSDTLEFEVIGNPNIGVMGRAGMQSAQMIVDKGVQVILTGNIGPNAFQILSTAGVQIVAGCTGTLRETIRRFNSDQLQPVTRATVPEYFGVRTDI
jgi:predicted Fe-Mo cluster-binding NifX family protein